MPNPSFWEGFGECPLVRGRSVLEVGCGQGARMLQMADAGARRLVGVDPDANVIRLAQYVLAGTRCELNVGMLHQLLPEQFDIIISENTLEHVLNVPELLTECRTRLVPGGRLYIGFSSLWHAPDGDHGWLRQTLPGYPDFSWPWGHLLFPRWDLVQSGHLYLNKLTVHDFEAMFNACGMRIVRYSTNFVHSRKGRLLAQLAHIPVLTKYCTLNVSVVFDRGYEDAQTLKVALACTKPSCH